MELTPQSPPGIGMALYGLCRLLKPRRIVELGCHRGHTTRYLALAALENGGEAVRAWDISKTVVGCAQNLCVDLPVEFVVSDVLKEPLGSIACDFAFIDIDPKRSYTAAFQRLDLPEHGFVAAHDLTYNDGVGVKELREHLDGSGWNTLGIHDERGLLLASRR